MLSTMEGAPAAADMGGGGAKGLSLGDSLAASLRSLRDPGVAPALAVVGAVLVLAGFIMPWVNLAAFGEYDMPAPPRTFGALGADLSGWDLLRFGAVSPAFVVVPLLMVALALAGLLLVLLGRRPFALCAAACGVLIIATSAWLHTLFDPLGTSLVNAAFLAEMLSTGPGAPVSLHVYAVAASRSFLVVWIGGALLSYSGFAAWSRLKASRSQRPGSVGTA